MGSMGQQIADRGAVEIAPDLCKGCGLCVLMCPDQLLVRTSALNRRGFRPIAYVGQGCNGCGICYRTCPEPGAIRVTRF
jgi:NAD-dependent dihydropyrimidine dehydrogenase PreA subunit